MVMFCLPLSLWVRMKRDVTPATEYLYPKSFQMYFLLSSPQLNKYIFFFSWRWWRRLLLLPDRHHYHQQEGVSFQPLPVDV